MDCHSELKANWISLSQVASGQCVCNKNRTRTGTSNEETPTRFSLLRVTTSQHHHITGSKEWARCPVHSFPDTSWIGKCLRVEWQETLAHLSRRNWEEVCWHCLDSWENHIHRLEVWRFHTSFDTCLSLCRDTEAWPPERITVLTQGRKGNNHFKWRKRLYCCYAPEVGHKVGFQQNEKWWFQGWKKYPQRWKKGSKRGAPMITKPIPNAALSWERDVLRRSMGQVTREIQPLPGNRNPL